VVTRQWLLPLILATLRVSFVVHADEQVKKNEVIVIGTLHKPSEKFTNVDLLRVLKHVDPDVILYELDSTFSDRRGQLRLYGTVEADAVNAFRRTSPVLVLPYDIEGRNQIYAAFHYFEIQKEYETSVIEVYRQGLLSTEAQSLYKEILGNRWVLIALTQGKMELFNSTNCDAAFQRKHERSAANLKRIIELTPDLARFREYAEFESEFWELRNRTMVRNILRYARQFPGKRVVVVCGAEHRYFLVRELKAAQSKGSISLREFWTYARYNRASWTDALH
jgi:hypothetical protein